MAREKILLTTPRTALLQHSLPSQLKRHLLSKKPCYLQRWIFDPTESATRKICTMFFYGTQRTTHPLIDPRAWEAPVLQQYKISGYSPKIWGGNDGLLRGEGCKVHGRLRNDGRASRDNLKRLGACALSPYCLVLLGHWDEPSRTAVFADDPASENVQDGACYMVGFMKDHFPSIIAKSTHPEGDTEQRSEPWIAEAGKEVHLIHLRYKIARAII